MSKFKQLLLAILAISLFSTVGYSQQTQAYVVVSSCGSPTYIVGAIRYGTMDTTGKICDSSSVSGTPSVNVAVGTLTTDYTSGATATVLSTTSGTVLTASIVGIQHIRCWNQTSSNATVSITNTAGVNIVPPLFVVPALGSVTFIDSVVGEEWTGIKWWSGTASAILCKAKGKQ